MVVLGGLLLALLPPPPPSGRTRPVSGGELFSSPCPGLREGSCLGTHSTPLLFKEGCPEGAGWLECGGRNNIRLWPIRKPGDIV